MTPKLSGLCAVREYVIDLDAGKAANDVDKLTAGLTPGFAIDVIGRSIPVVHRDDYDALEKKNERLEKALEKCKEQRNYVIIHTRGGLDDRSESIENSDKELQAIIDATEGE